MQAFCVYQMITSISLKRLKLKYTIGDALFNVLKQIDGIENGRYAMPQTKRDLLLL